VDERAHTIELPWLLPPTRREHIGWSKLDEDQSSVPLYTKRGTPTHVSLNPFCTLSAGVLLCSKGDTHAVLTSPPSLHLHPHVPWLPSHVPWLPSKASHLLHGHTHICTPPCYKLSQPDTGTPKHPPRELDKQDIKQTIKPDYRLPRVTPETRVVMTNKLNTNSLKHPQAGEPYANRKE